LRRLAVRSLGPHIVTSDKSDDDPQPVRQASANPTNRAFEDEQGQLERAVDR
jgi:hypothetical protein